MRVSDDFDFSQITVPGGYLALTRDQIKAAFKRDGISAELVDQAEMTLEANLRDGGVLEVKAKLRVAGGARHIVTGETGDWKKERVMAWLSPHAWSIANPQPALPED